MTQQDGVRAMTTLKAVRFLILAGFVSFVAACKIAVMVVEGGEVQSVGSGTCLEGTICIHQVDDTSYTETFTAAPNSGWVFEKWNSGFGFFCGDSTDPVCVVSGEGAEGNEAIQEIVASDRTFYLMPVFVPAQPITDTVTVDGKEWAQADLFFNLSWDEINAVCPAGVCGDSGQLNGYDMTGWTWASVDEVKALFNVYIGDNVLGPETDFYQDVTGEAVERFFDDGWRPTSDGILRDFVGTEWRVVLQDIEPGAPPRYAGEGYVLLLHELEFPDNPNSPEIFEAGNFKSASFKASLDGDIDDYDILVGALFYR